MAGLHSLGARSIFGSLGRDAEMGSHFRPKGPLHVAGASLHSRGGMPSFGFRRGSRVASIPGASRGALRGMSAGDFAYARDASRSAQATFARVSRTPAGPRARMTSSAVLGARKTGQASSHRLRNAAIAGGVVAGGIYGVGRKRNRGAGQRSSVYGQPGTMGQYY